MYKLISSTNNIPKWEELLSKNNSTLKLIILTTFLRLMTYTIYPDCKKQG